jgi:hypothetical protein
MADFYTFNLIPFSMVMPSSGETPHWKVQVEATDRKLIGTDRFEHNVRSRQYALEGELWVEPTDSASTSLGYWQALQDAYAAGTVATLVTPAGTTAQAVIGAFDVAPLRGGVDGYRGKVAFGLPGGRS